MLRQDDAIKAMLVMAGWNHGRKWGGHLASVMVMSCLAQRQRLGWGSWLEIIKNIPKYAATLDVPNDICTEIWEPGFVRLLHEVEGIFDGSVDYSRGAVYWCDSNDVTNPWFREKILADATAHPRVAEMNSLMLFR